MRGLGALVVGMKKNSAKSILNGDFSRSGGHLKEGEDYTKKEIQELLIERAKAYLEAN